MSESELTGGHIGGNSSLRAGRSKPVLRETAYRKFMDYLMSGQLRPGLLVSQRELCESTGATIGAMREALKRLEAEGIITLIPQRGVMVREPEEKEINDVYEARAIVEAHAARSYALTGDLEMLADIKRRTQEILELKAETREEAAVLSRQRIDVDDLLHQTILGALNNQAIDEIFDRFRIQIRVNRLSVQHRYIDSRPSLREHLVIIEALGRRDGDAAAKAMVTHLVDSCHRAVGLY